MMVRTFAGTALALAATCANALPESRQLHQLMARYHALGQLDGAVLVAERGKVVYQHGFGLASREWNQPNTTDTAYRIASLTKQFTAMLVLQLVDQGKLGLDDTIGQYVPDLAPEIGSKVTLHQLLNHTSGLVDYANYPGFWTGRLGSIVPRADLMAIINGPLEFAPGSAGKYNSSGYTLLGYAIEEVTGKPYAQVLDEMILLPLKMTRSGYDDPARIVPRKATGYTRVLGEYQNALNMWVPNVFSGGGMYSTVGDLLKWDQALYGTGLLSARSKSLMFTPYVKDDVWGDLGYGYGWMIGKRVIAGQARLVHEHGGNANGFRTLITRYPDEQRLVVLLLNEGNGSKRRGIYDISSAIARVLYRAPVAQPALSLTDAIVADIRQHGMAALEARLPSLRAAHAPLKDASDLNNLAYDYVGQRKLDAAVAVLSANLAIYPKDANSHDSLGEIHLMRGDKSAAARHYRIAMALDPANAHAAKVVKELEGQP